MKYRVTVGDAEVDVDLDGDVISVDGKRSVAHLNEVEGTPVRMVTIGDEVHRVVARRGVTRGRYTLWLDGFRYEVEALDERTRTIRALAGAGKEASGPAPLVAPMPGMIIRISVEVGDIVQAGQGLIVMEAMKMENELRAGSAGRVKAILAREGTAVEKGAILLELM